MAKLRDMREKFFLVNNEYLNGHAAVCGIYATGVYFEICRHANKDQSSFPSITHICEKLNISKPTAIDAIKKLEAYKIIRKEKIEGKSTTYYLLDKSEWSNTHTGQSPLPVNDINQTGQSPLPVNDINQTGQSPLPVPVNHVYPKNTNIRILNKNTNISQRNFKKEAIEILTWLNKKVNRNYRPVDANLAFIEARLKSGVTPDECRMVIARKAREWLADEKMTIYLRPATLFNKTKFEQYLGECVAKGDNHEQD